MRHICSLLLVAFALTLSYSQTTKLATNNPPVPQTAREALLEMLSGKSIDGFLRHLPAATKNALMKAGNDDQVSLITQLAGASMAFSGRGGHLDTFDTGSTLLRVEQNEGREKFEVTVEGDDLQGDEDRIELSFQAYKDGAPQPLPVIPRLTLTMKQESEVWKLYDIAVGIHVPLGDPDYLRGLAKIQSAGYEANARVSVSALVTAESSYSATYPGKGFTCKLSELGGVQQGAKPSAAHAMLIDPSLSSGEKSGYKFTISGCDSTPAAHFQITAVPLDPDWGAKAFCADETGVLRYAKDGTASSCVREGEAMK